jgi:undecaprenyl-diphosphatase
MEFLYLLALSLVQGLTEFLPVSSSGHLVVLPRIFDWPDQGILIDVALHIGTLTAILVYYRRDIFSILHAVLHWNDKAQKKTRNLGLYILAGSVPAGIAGLAVAHFFPEGIRDIQLIAMASIFFGLLMGAVDIKCPKNLGLEDITLKSALIIGVAQVFALLPGGSRSGITLTAARFLGFNRVDAARFSFLLGIPVMMGAGALSLLEIAQSHDPDLWRNAFLAIGMAFVAALGAIHFMMRWLQRGSLVIFAVYRVLFALFILFFLEG